MSSITVHPEQAAELAKLLTYTHAVACDIVPDEHWSLRVVTYHAPEDRDPADAPADARWWTISCVGTVREIAPTPEQVAA